MAAQKFLTLVSGLWKEAQAILSSAGAGDANKIPALDSGGKLDISFMPSGVGNTSSIVASENIANGDYVNIWDDAGTIKVRKANATNNTKPAHGFVLVGGSTSSTLTVYPLSAINTALSGLTKGANYFLSTVAGGVVSTAPSSSGNLVQRLGIGISATVLNGMDSDWVELV